jgi:uncharacterized protein YjiS (DUF1127 family)
MSTMSLGHIALLPHRMSYYWRRARHGIAAWRHQARSRSELLGLGDRYLRDIGISRHTPELDACQPFWMESRASSYLEIGTRSRDGTPSRTRKAGAPHYQRAGS